MSELTFRARRILYATITEYISSGEPVGSRRLSKHYGINLSPATIRNVLADLEDAGFLRQPHTSAGRVPTDQGFRVFVDALVQMREITQEDRQSVLSRLRSVQPGPDVLKEAGDVLSSLTGAAAVVTSPRPDQSLLSHLRFMPLRSASLLAVLITKNGAVLNLMVSLETPIEALELERINNLVAELLAAGSCSLAQLRQRIASQMEGDRGMVAKLRESAAVVVGAAAEEQGPEEVLIEGQGRLFDRPEFLDAEKIRRFLRAFQDKERLVGLLGTAISAGGVQVRIGSEAKLDDVEDVSLISASYGQPGDATGTLAVIGPTRIDYAKVVPLVGFTAKVIGELLSGQLDEDG